MSTASGMLGDLLKADQRMGSGTAVGTPVIDANGNQGAVKATSVAIGASGSEVAITATPAELNILDAAPASISFAPAAAAANISEVTITVRDAAGVAIAKPFILDVYLSDAASGLALTGTSASGTVQAKAASGALLQEVTAKKHLRVQTLASGIYILEITDTAKTAFRVCAILPSSGVVQVSAALVAGNYGA